MARRIQDRTRRAFAPQPLSGFHFSTVDEFGINDNGQFADRYVEVSDSRTGMILFAARGAEAARSTAYAYLIGKEAA